MSKEFVFCKICGERSAKIINGNLECQLVSCYQAGYERLLRGIEHVTKFQKTSPRVYVVLRRLEEGCEGVKQEECFLGEFSEKHTHDTYYNNALRISVDGVLTELGKALLDDCGHVNQWAANPGKWPLRCCVSCANKALSKLHYE